MDGPNVLQYVKQNWNTITNDEFRNMLCQIAHAMKSLHDAGIIHRNIHFDSVIVAVPSTTKAQVSATTSRSVDDDLQDASSSSSKKGQPKKALKPLHHTVTCYLGDMWFLFNPRIHGSTTIRSGAQMGRADWGSVSTAPPEAKTITSGGLDMNPDSSTNSRIYKAVNARMMVSRRNDEQVQSNPVKKTILSNNINSSSSSSSISDRSDVYAFGVCVYYWATCGLQILPLTMGGQVDMISVRRNMPLKWKPWLISLLQMCLQTKPEMRASAKDIHLFLSSRFGKT